MCYEHARSRLQWSAWWWHPRVRLYGTTTTEVRKTLPLMRRFGATSSIVESTRCEHNFPFHKSKKHVVNSLIIWSNILIWRIELHIERHSCPQNMINRYLLCWWIFQLEAPNSFNWCESVVCNFQCNFPWHPAMLCSGKVSSWERGNQVCKTLGFFIISNQISSSWVWI